MVPFADSIIVIPTSQVCVERTSDLRCRVYTVQVTMNEAGAITDAAVNLAFSAGSDAEVYPNYSHTQSPIILLLEFKPLSMR